MAADERMRGVSGLAFAQAMLDFFRRETFFASSEGAAIHQTITHSGGGIEATAIGEGELQRRSYPNSFRGHIRAAGYEHIRTIPFADEAERIARGEDVTVVRDEAEEAAEEAAMAAEAFFEPEAIAARRSREEADEGPQPEPAEEKK
jgi:TldD protein